MQITINGTLCTVNAETISHEEICKLAAKPEYASVVYRGPRKGDSQRYGITYKGETIELEEDMRFTCVVTNNA